jgi:hypothetical protein
MTQVGSVLAQVFGVCDVTIHGRVYRLVELYASNCIHALRIVEEKHELEPNDRLDERSCACAFTYL